MKTQKSIILVVVMLLSVSFYLSANDSDTNNDAKADLRKDLVALFEKVPFNDLYTTHGSNQLLIKFKVDANCQLTDIKVLGDNEELSCWAESILLSNDITANPVLKESGYFMKLNLKDGNKHIH